MNYKDIDGNDTTLYNLVRTEPGWAESRIDFMNKEIDDLKKAICIHVREEGDYLCLQYEEDEPDKQAISGFIKYWDEEDWS